MTIEFGVLGPIAAWNDSAPIAMKGPRHRAVLGRLIVARGRVVPLSMLIDDLWDAPPADPVGTIRTFVGALRRAIEPLRPPRAPPELLVTEGAGYALRAEPDTVDATRFERAVTGVRDRAPADVLAGLDAALGWWRGPAYADFVGEHWARTERSRLSELRLHAVERRADALIELDRAGEAVADLDSHVAEHPWREEGWRLLSLALYRTGRQADALGVLRRTRTRLAQELGLDPGPALIRLEADILNHAGHLGETGADAAGRVWADTAAAYDRAVAPRAQARLRSTVDLLRSLAVTGGNGLEAARSQRLATINAAEEIGDADLAARVIGAYDVPAIWSRSDDPEQSAQIVEAAERTLAALPPDGSGATRSRLLATIAVESRGRTEDHGVRAAEQAERIARRLDDPALLAFALNGRFMQSFRGAGLSARRDEIGSELVTLSARHGMSTYEILGRLIRMQARIACGDVAGADEHAAAADVLAERHESPLVSVFTGWYRALRLALSGEQPETVAAAYRKAASRLDGAGMPGLEHGLLPLALLALRVAHDRPAPVDASIDWGPYGPWARPLVLIAEGRADAAARAVVSLPDPPPDHLQEVLWCLAARAAVAAGDRDVIRRAYAALKPAAGEHAGAGGGLFTIGSVARHLDDLERALER